MQYIVNYDIENSVICCVMPENKHDYEKLNGKCREVTEYLCKCFDRKETRFFPRELFYIAEKMLYEYYPEYRGVLRIAPMTHKYLSNFLIYKVQETPIDKIVIDGDILSTWYAYTPQDDLKCFKKLIDLWLAGNDILFCCHNYSYENRYIRNNVPEFYEMLISNSVKAYSVLADSSSKIKTMEFIWGKDIKIGKNGEKSVNDPHYFIIHDTMLMAGNRSISNLGASYNYPKLDYDYDVCRIDKNDLEKHDYEYNRRDNEVALLFILDLMRQNPEYINIVNMPLSATQHYKKLCKGDIIINPLVTDQKDGKEKPLFRLYSRAAKAFNMKSLYLHNAFYNASGGGLIGVNPLYCGMWIDNCHSFDISSAHPSQVFNRGKFPVCYKSKHYKGDMKKLLDFFRRKTERLINDPKGFYNAPYGDVDYLMKIRFIGVTEKVLKNNNVVDCLGIGTINTDNTDFECKDQWDNVKIGSRTHITKLNIDRTEDTEHKHVKNGKIRQAKYTEGWFYGIDLVYILSFYNFKEIIIKEAYEMPLGYAHEYILNEFEHYGDLKNTYKCLGNIAKKEGYEKLKETLEVYVREGKAQSYTLNSLDAHKDDYVDFVADAETHRIKAIFNGLFGINYSNPIKRGMTFDKEYNIVYDGEVVNYDQAITVTTTHFGVGSYIAGFTRLQLACMLWFVINNGGTALYWATDSVKCFGVDEHLFDGWLDGLPKTSKAGVRNKHEFGKVDCETKGNTHSMYVIETLKHVDICKNENKVVKDKLGDRIDIDITISGFRGKVYLSDVLDKWCVKMNGDTIINSGVDYTAENVEKLKEELTPYLIPQIIPAVKTGKIAPDYTYEGFETPLGQKNFAPLWDKEYNLGGYKMT